jgi:hypothetical protein
MVALVGAGEDRDSGELMSVGPMSGRGRAVVRVSVCVVVACATLAFVVGSGAASTASTGRLASLATVPSGPFVELLTLSCSSASACTAVGALHANVQDAPGVPVAERWNGKTWAIEAMPTPPGNVSHLWALRVSCPSSSACFAVGSSGAVPGSAWAWRWNGTRWFMQRMPSGPGGPPVQLSDLSCASPRACTAVGDRVVHGSAIVRLVERWNGRKWSLQPIGHPAGRLLLSEISCPSIRACVAIGGFAARWNGSAWMRLALPSQITRLGGVLDDVSCASATACVVVGNYLDCPGPNASCTSGRLWFSWNGARWSSVRTDQSGTRYEAVSCGSASWCVAVGLSGVLRRWNGMGWATQLGARSAQAETQGDVSCVSPTACMAVGSKGEVFTGLGFSYVPVAWLWNGRRWTDRSPSNPTTEPKIRLKDSA